MKKFILSFVYLVNFVYCNDGEPNVKYINDHIPHVFERNLITLEVDSQSIIDEHYRYGTANTSVKNFQGLTMAFVTPWNKRGMKLSQIFRGKFDVVVPTWYEIIKRDKLKYYIDGDKYYDEEFINNVRTGNDEGEPWDDIPPPKVAPLFHLAKFSQDDFTSIVDPEANSAEEIPALIKTIVDKVEEYGFDGLTIETIMPMYLENFLYDLGKELESKNKTLYVVITPQSMHGDQPAFSKTQFDHLSEVVGGFALMTHGFSKEKPGPNSPISWLREEVSHFCKNPEEASCKKIFLGINWHGTGFKENNEARPVTGEVFFQLVSEFHPEFKWDEEGEEHFFTIKNGEDLSVSIYFPTLKSLSVRLDLATELGVNICLVEIGQGFDYFFDLL